MSFHQASQPSAERERRTAEDDALRSAHMRHLLREVYTDRAPDPAAGAEVPKVIVQYWHDASDVPSDVEECMGTWEPLCSNGYTRLLFDDAAASAFIARDLDPTHSAAFARCRHPAMRSDYFRLCWIFTAGGVYIDADDWYIGSGIESAVADRSLKIQPLCYDTETNQMVPSSRFLREPDPPATWIHYVNNNPLIAPSGHAVVGQALRRATSLLLRPGLQSDVQSTTGPGNLTASLVDLSVTRGVGAADLDVRFLPRWEEVAESRWPLSYRNDERNWRLWNPND